MALLLRKFDRIDAMSVKGRLGHHVIVRIHARARIRLLAIDGGDLSHICVGRAARLREGMDAVVAQGPSAESHGEAVGLPINVDTAIVVYCPGFVFEELSGGTATGGEVQVYFCRFCGV